MLTSWEKNSLVGSSSEDLNLLSVSYPRFCMWLNSLSGDVIDPVYCLSGITDHKSASNQVLNAMVVLLVPHSHILNLFEHLPGATF